VNHKGLEQWVRRASGKAGLWGAYLLVFRVGIIVEFAVASLAEHLAEDLGGVSELKIRVLFRFGDASFCLWSELTLAGGYLDREKWELSI
jgi:hypothetical protein